MGAVHGLGARRPARATALITRRIIPIAAAAAALLFFAVALPRTKAAMLRDAALTNSHQLAVSRADPAFATLAQAQLELRAARDAAAPDARARLEQALMRMSEQEAELRSLIREFDQ